MNAVRQQSNHAPNLMAQIEVNRFQAEFARFDFRKVENVVDDAEQSVSALLDRLSLVALFGGQLCVEQEVGHAVNAVHGGADFVAHIGQKLALGPIGDEGSRCELLGPVGFLEEALVGGGEFDVGSLQGGGAFPHHPFEVFEFAFGLLIKTPLLGEGAGELQNLDVVERFFEDHQPVGVAKLLHHLLPRIIRIGGADHDLEVRVFLPDPRNGFDAIPAGRHSDIDEGHGIGAFLFQGALDQGQPFLALERRVEFKNRMAGSGQGSVAEQGCFTLCQR